MTNTSLVGLISAVQLHAYKHQDDADTNGAWSIWVGDMHVAGELGDVISAAGATTIDEAIAAAKVYVDTWHEGHPSDEQERSLVRVLDTTTGPGGVSVIYRVDEANATVRVRIKRDHYAHQSFAVAEVLTSDRTWTNVLDEPTDHWHDSSGVPATSESVLLMVAEQLAERAASVLVASR